MKLLSTILAGFVAAKSTLPDWINSVENRKKIFWRRFLGCTEISHDFLAVAYKK